jgi:hypothetical protein
MRASVQGSGIGCCLSSVAFWAGVGSREEPDISKLQNVDILILR